MVQKPRIAICFFGITRSLPNTIGSIENNILTPARDLGEVRGSYCPTAVRCEYDTRRVLCRRRRRLVEGGATYRFVHDHLLYRRWSPEQIAHRPRLMEPDNPLARVSHETIYATIYAQPRGDLKAAMIEALRRAKPASGCRRTTLARSSIVPESLRIIHRPEGIEALLVPGHWEGDLIKGTFNRSSVGTLVERKTSFVVLCKMNCNGAETVLNESSLAELKFAALLGKPTCAPSS